MLKGKPIQHREVQGHESALFLSYFPHGIIYNEGGVDSAFHNVDPNAYTPRLFQVKGKRNVRCTQVECKTTSLNDGDSFILDAGLNIVQWNGKEANRYEKFKALEVATKIKDSERGGKAKLIFLDSGKEDSNPDAAVFWKELGGKGTIKGAHEGGDDEATGIPVASLHRVSDASGTLTVTEVGRAKLTKDMLDPNDVFILDTGSEVFVWIGKGATKQEREKGLENGQEYLKNHNRPSFTPLTRIPQGGEPPMFKSAFIQFDREVPSQGPAGFERQASVAPEKKIELDALFKKQAAAEEKVIDINGKIDIWRIENLNKVPVDPATHGQFYSGDSYIVLYSYKIGTKPAWIIYFWQGTHSSQDEKAVSALLAVQLDDELGGDPVQVRVVQGKEPNHFLALFKGKFVCHRGGIASGFKNRQEAGDDASQGTNHALYHIRGTNAVNTRAIQVETKAASLNSGDSFALVTHDKVYLWFGKLSNNDERSFATNLVQTVLKQGRSVEHVDENNEHDEFWTALGGKTEYADHAESELVMEPRLFEFTIRGNTFMVEEIINFHQEDLAQDGVYLLDTFNVVYVWVGNSARREDKDLALTSALKYVENAPDGRSKDTPIFMVPAGVEPPMFCTSFVEWDSVKANDFTDPYQAKLATLKDQFAVNQTTATGAPSSAAPKAAAATPSPTAASPVAPAPKPTIERVTSASVGYDNPEFTKYSYEQIKKGGVNIDPKCKEAYLSDAEFQTVFGQDRAGYNGLAQWKKDEKKKKLNLF